MRTKKSSGRVEKAIIPMCFFREVKDGSGNWGVFFAWAVTGSKGASGLISAAVE